MGERAGVTMGLLHVRDSLLGLPVFILLRNIPSPVRGLLLNIEISSIEIRDVEADPFILVSEPPLGDDGLERERGCRAEFLAL